MTSFEISFEGSTAEAAQLSNELEQDIREAAAVDITRKKERQDTQDFGSTLVLVLGTPVAIIVAKAVATFLSRHSGATIRISKNGELVAQNLDSKDAARIAEAFSGRKTT